jgi:ATP-dependent RNA helicase SUPV3L1/SUV3
VPEASAKPAPAGPVIGFPEAPTLVVAEPPAQAPGSSGISVPAQQHPPSTELAAQDLIEVWRPGRRDEHRARRPRSEGSSRARRQRRETAAGPAADGAAGVAEASPGPDARRDGEGVARRPRRRDGRDERAERRQPSERPEHRERTARGERRVPDQGGRPQRRARSERDRGDRPDRDPELRAKYIKGRGEGREPREREPDPNSPFAKLAALKEQLEGNVKEPR